MIYGQPVTFGGKSEPELLWTNASPTSVFAEQTVNVATGYSAYIVELRAYTTDATTMTWYVPFGGYSNKCLVKGNDMFRYITDAGDGYVTFGGSTSGGYTGIPTRIWGVKFTL